MANIALPGTSSFVGEFLLLAGIYKENIITSIIAALGVILGGGYSLWLYNRIIFGNVKQNYTLKFKDINYKEFSIMLSIIIFVILLGLFPNFLISFLHLNCVFIYN
jgi:NADH:ubiquinone oxidoreductase subunit 4 (subunit M)